MNFQYSTEKKLGVAARRHPLKVGRQNDDVFVAGLLDRSASGLKTVRHEIKLL